MLRETRKTTLVGFASAAALLALLLLLTAQRTPSVRAEQAATSGGHPHYTVVMTEGHNLLVTDNAKNTVYFYTVDKDKPIGSPLKLRASVDLAKVGDAEIQITPHNVEKSADK